MLLNLCIAIKLKKCVHVVWPLDKNRNRTRYIIGRRRNYSLFLRKFSKNKVYIELNLFNKNRLYGLIKTCGTPQGISSADWLESGATYRTYWSFYNPCRVLPLEVSTCNVFSPVSCSSPAKLATVSDALCWPSLAPGSCQSGKKINTNPQPSSLKM